MYEIMNLTKFRSESLKDTTNRFFSINLSILKSLERPKRNMKNCLEKEKIRIKIKFKKIENNNNSA